MSEEKRYSGMSLGQQYEALDTITELLREAGPDSGLATAFDGCVSLAERNIAGGCRDSLQRWLDQSKERESNLMNERMDLRGENVELRHDKQILKLQLESTQKQLDSMIRANEQTPRETIVKKVKGKIRLLIAMYAEEMVKWERMAAKEKELAEDPECPQVVLMTGENNAECMRGCMEAAIDALHYIEDDPAPDGSMADWQAAGILGLFDGLEKGAPVPIDLAYAIQGILLMLDGQEPHFTVEATFTPAGEKEEGEDDGEADS
ncbi:MAG: hypothetical protein LUD50_03000 [Clostridia bacterium]|nr:hypothetical protein [Clostridia bacterium]